MNLNPSHNEDEYYFPDEGVGLIDDDIKPSSGAPGGYSMGLFAAGLLALVTACLLIIGWILWSRLRCKFLLAFAILATLAFLFALFALFIAFRGKKLDDNAQNTLYGSKASRDHTLETVVFVLALLFLAFFLVASLFLLLHRPFNCNKKKTYCGKDWNKNKRFYFALACLSLLAAALLALLAMNIFANYPMTSSLNVLFLYLALFLAFLFAFIAVLYFLRIRKNARRLSLDWNKDKFLYNGYFKTLVILACIAILLAFLNAICGVLKNKLILLLFGFVLLVWVVVALLMFG